MPSMPSEPAYDSAPLRDLDQLLAEAPFVRDLARQLIGRDADEVVQRTWLQALHHGARGGAVERPRHWLGRIVRNVAANLRRDDRRRRAREQQVAGAPLVPSSAELAEREERRRALVAAVDALPGTLRTVVLLRWFDGLPPRDIARALGVPAATVSTQLQRALALLRERLDAAHGGDRRAWALPLVALAAPPALPPAPWSTAPAAVPAGGALLLGAIVMTTKTKLAVLVGVLLVAASAWLWSRAARGPDDPVPRDGIAAPATAAVATPEPSQPAAPHAATGAPEREAVLPPATMSAPGAGEVVVRVLHADASPAPDRGLGLQRTGSDGRFTALRQRTDAAGIARYAAVPPGSWYVGDGFGPGKRVTVVAGETAEIELKLPAGLTVEGVVVDAAKVPVAGALVEMERMAFTDTLPEVVAISGADGRFSVRACPDACLLGARAFGHVASRVKFVFGKDGNTATVELVLGRDGGALGGVVVDAAGAPVERAVVIVGDGAVSGIPGSDDIAPFGAVTRSDGEGRFLALGVAAGEQPVQVRAPGFAPWTGTCTIAAGATAVQRVELTRGGVVRGTVRDAAGNGAQATIEVGAWKELAHQRVRSGADGAFELAGLPVGEVRLRVSHDRLGLAEATVTTTPDGPVAVELQLSRGRELKGRVVDPDGQPVAGVTLECIDSATRGADGWFRFVKSDKDGAFAADNCPATGTLQVVVRARGFEELRLTNVDASAGEVQVRLRREAPPSVRIVAHVVDADGKPIANAMASARREGVRGSTGIEATATDGRVELGPVAPGTWRVSIRDPQRVEFQSEPRALAADSTWDLGTIVLGRGGTARLRVVGEPPPGARYHVSNAARTRSWGVADATQQHRTSPLAGGDYVVVVSGDGVAAAAVPFTIREGEEVEVEVRPGAGVAQRVVCALPPDANGDGVSIAIARGDRRVASVWAPVRPGDTAATAWLAPGDYVATATLGDLRGTAPFTVGAASGEPVSITLR
jgi:RNA polymerase sigma factor (sigma-70 family)